MASTKGLSLHVGLNEIDPAHYGDNGELNACINDAEAMRDLAKAQGIEVMNVLTNSQGTRGAVKAGIEEAAKKLKSGDFFLYTFSGHGSQTPDLNKDEKSDKFDETWCLYDGMLIDDEADELWKNFASGVRVLVLLDCCHSGTAIKNMPGIFGGVALAKGPKPKMLALRQAKITFKNNLSFYKGIKAGTKEHANVNANKQTACSVRHISGCQANQLSMDGWANSAFTEQLLNVWGSGAFAGNYADFSRSIALKLPPTQSPNHFTKGVLNGAYDAQRPFSV